MIFFFKKKKIVVDCFINNELIFNSFKIDNAMKYVPEQWKKYPATTTSLAYPDLGSRCNITTTTSTIKKCVGFINLFKTGFILPMWTDFSLQTYADGNFIWNTPIGGVGLNITSHKNQYWEDLYPGFCHAKITSPWILKEKSGVNFYFTQCDWNYTKDTTHTRIISGIVDYRNQHSTNINMFVKKEYTFSIDVGTPMVHMVPLTEHKVVLKHHLLDSIEYDKLTPPILSHRNHYKINKNANDMKSKCPFGFGK